MGFAVKGIATNEKYQWLECEQHMNKQKTKALHRKTWNKRKGIGFYMKRIGTNEKAMVSMSKAQEPTRKQWFKCKRLRNHIKKQWLLYKKHRNQLKQMALQWKAQQQTKTHWFD